MKPESHYFQREAWGPGPWSAEPDAAIWRDEATGLGCAMRRGPFGAWCGYVRIPEGHPLHGAHYSDPLPEELRGMLDGARLGKRSLIDVFVAAMSPMRIGMLLDVHGSVSYSNDGGDHLPPGFWWGFACANADDLQPGLEAFRRDMHAEHPEMGPCGFGEIYRDEAYVRAECASMAGQVAAIALLGQLDTAEAKEIAAGVIARMGTPPDAGDAS